jgi:hypothetical protein
VLTWRNKGNRKHAGDAHRNLDLQCLEKARVSRNNISTTFFSLGENVSVMLSALADATINSEVHEPGHGRIREMVMDKISETGKRGKK